jgi:hypothetical protein
LRQQGTYNPARTCTAIEVPRTLERNPETREINLAMNGLIQYLTNQPAAD